MTPEEYKDFLAKRKPEKVAKYRNVKKVANGVEFDSTKEANRYVDLCLWQKTGQIHGLEHQKPFPLVVNGVEVVHQCMKPDTGEPAFRWSDPHQTAWRIHTKRVT